MHMATYLFIVRTNCSGVCFPGIFYSPYGRLLFTLSEERKVQHFSCAQNRWDYSDPHKHSVNLTDWFLPFTRPCSFCHWPHLILSSELSSSTQTSFWLSLACISQTALSVAVCFWYRRNVVQSGPLILPPWRLVCLSCFKLTGALIESFPPTSI